MHSILCIDDQPGRYNFLTSHFDVDYASAVSVAVSKIIENNYSAFIVDLGLPWGDKDSLPDWIIEIINKAPYQGLGIIKLLNDFYFSSRTGQTSLENIPIIIVSGNSKYYVDKLVQQFRFEHNIRNRLLVLDIYNIAYERHDDTVALIRKTLDAYA